MVITLIINTLAGRYILKNILTLFHLSCIRGVENRKVVENGVNDRWDFYKDNAQEWRWKRKHKSGDAVYASPRGFKDKLTCLKHARKHGYKD